MPKPAPPRTAFGEHGHLVPFAAVAFSGASVLAALAVESLGLRPLPFLTEVLAPLAAWCFTLLGAAPILQALRRPGFGKGFAAVAAVLGLFAWLEWRQQAGIDREGFSFLRHLFQFSGGGIASLPPALGFLFFALGVILLWSLRGPSVSGRLLALALAGSVTIAYGFTSLIAERVGLNALEEWNTLARLGPPVASALVVLGAGLILLATRGGANTRGIGPAWLWSPVVIGGLTITFIFWFALREREIAYLNNATQLTINNTAAILSNQIESQTEFLGRMAARWNRDNGTDREVWEQEAILYLRDLPALRSLQLVDANVHTRWVWPREGNEDAPSFNHASDPLRRRALEQARATRRPVVAAPILSAVQPPTFVVYTALLRGGQFDGYMAGEFSYAAILGIIDRQLNLSTRFAFSATVRQPSGPAGEQNHLVYSTALGGETAGQRFHQSATFSLPGQSLTLEFIPRPVYISANRQQLPTFVLLAGLGVSILLGLVVNLAQAALSRQRAAEITASQALHENEERRRVEAQLKVADERLNLALDSTQVGVYEWDIPTNRVFFSPSVWTSLGYDPARMQGTLAEWSRLVHPEDMPLARQAIRAHLQGLTPLIESEHRARHAGGEWQWIAARAKCVGFDVSGRPLRVSGTCQNITPRKRAEEALRASQAATRKLSFVASKTDNGVIITDPAGRIDWANESFTRLAEYVLGDITGRPLAQFLSTADADPGALDFIRHAFAHCEPITRDVLLHTKSGRRYYLHLDMQPVRNDEGVHENFVAVATDITARVEAEQQLRRAKAEADSASRAKSDFLASMSHEIRTPMNGVIGMTSLLLETALSAEQRDYVHTIRTSGDALLSVINGILDFSKIEAGHMELENQPFELAHCLEEALDIFAVQAADKDIELAYDLDPAVPAWINGDITRLRQVLVNLLNNAVKFTDRGFITVEVRPALTRPAAPGEPLLLDFFITDTGIGIPSERLDVLFKPFSQVDTSTTRKYGGTGLGLAISDRLCHLMGGTIDVTSRFGAGSRFRFSIRTQPAAPVNAAHAARLPGAVVLAVDDHPLNRTVLERHLAAWGLTPLVAADAAAARAMFADARVNLLIIDHNLAGASGRDLLAQLQAGRPPLPAVLFTSAAETAPRNSPENPLLLTLPKPIKPALLHEALQRLLAGHLPPEEIPLANGRPAAVLAANIPLDVLIVEDNPVNQKVAQLLLERFGYVADLADNGIDALHAVARRPYQLVLMDVQMPGMDGLATAREIRARQAAGPRPVIVALTANAMRGDRERCLAAGMDDYLSKPVKSEDIELVILRHFGQKAG